MSATALYWFQLQHAVHLRIDELAEVFKKGITANAAVAVPASGSEPPQLSTVFRLTQEEAAENWLSAMGAGCIVQLLADAQSVWQHPKLWRFLYAISKEKIAPRLEELLYASFHITQKDLRLIEKWDDDIGGRVDFDLERSTASIAGAVRFARAKKRAVHQILDQLLGVSRELAFGMPSKPKFGVTAAQIDTTPAPARPGPPVPSPMNEPTKESIGRHRVDKVLQAEREIKILRPLINSLADYKRIKIQHPDYITIQACDKNPALKKLLLGIQGNAQKKALRFAKQVAAEECNKQLSTIEKAWDLYKPDERRNPKKRNRKNAPPARSRKTRKTRKSRGKK